jgi:hypothetical protein
MESLKFIPYKIDLLKPPSSPHPFSRKRGSGRETVSAERVFFVEHLQWDRE